MRARYLFLLVRSFIKKFVKFFSRDLLMACSRRAVACLLSAQFPFYCSMLVVVFDVFSIN